MTICLIDFYLTSVVINEKSSDWCLALHDMVVDLVLPFLSLVLSLLPPSLVAHLTVCCLKLHMFVDL